MGNPPLPFAPVYCDGGRNGTGDAVGAGFVESIAMFPLSAGAAPVQRVSAASAWFLESWGENTTSGNS